MQYVLSVWERVTLMRAANGLQRVSTYQLRQVMNFIDKMDLNEEEEKEVGFVRMGQAFRWGNTTRTYIIDLNSSDMEILVLLKDALVAFPWQGQEAKEALTLFVKIGIDIEEVEAAAEAQRLAQEQASAELKERRAAEQKVGIDDVQGLKNDLNEVKGAVVEILGKKSKP